MEKVPLLDMWVVVGVVNVALGLIRKVRYLVSREQGAIWIEFIKRTWISHVDAMTFKDILLIVSENNAHKIRSRCTHWLLSVS